MTGNKSLTRCHVNEDNRIMLTRETPASPVLCHGCAYLPAMSVVARWTSVSLVVFGEGGDGGRG